MTEKKTVRKKSLSREKVLSIALKLADSNGIEALSMRRIAEALQVEAMSLYNHVGGKDDVLDGLVNLVACEFGVPRVGHFWKEEMHRQAVITHQVLLKHPWAAGLLISRVCTGPCLMHYANARVGCLRESGFSFEMADHAVNSIDNHIYGFTLQNINSPINPKEYAKAAQHYLPQIPEHDYPYLYGMAKLIIAGSHSGINNFEFGLELILDGLEALLEKE